MKNWISLGLLTLAAAVVPAAPALGAVSLVLSNNGGSSTSITAGQSFNVTLNLVSTGESVTAADYFLKISGAGAGHFRITNRDASGSPVSDLFKANTGDNGANAGVLDASVASLNSTNGLDLGGSIANVSSPLTGGTYVLAQYTITSDAGTAPGSYTLSTMSLDGTGYEGAAPSFNDTPFDQHASYSVTVTPAIGVGVPEPTGVVMVSLGLGALAFRRRR